MDTTFDSDGILTIAMSTGNDEIYFHKILADGKIIVFGAAHNGTDYDFAMAKINTDGSLDTSFGSGADGKAITSFATGNDYGRSGEILADGKILALGVSGGKFALARYTAGGILDTSFSGDGKLSLNESLSVTTTLSSGTHFIPRIKALSNGKILITGNSSNDFKTIRLLSDGSYDTSFDNDGVVIVDNNFDISSILLEKPDGKIITGGNSYVTNVNDARIKQIELDTNGSVISNTAKQVYDSYDDSITGTLKLSDQSIIVVSSAYINYKKTFVIEKFLPDGFPDTDFGTIGHTYIEASDDASKILLLPDNSIVIKSSTNLYKVTPSGILDTTFGTNGILDLLELTNYQANYNDDILLSIDNKILLACDYIQQSNPNNILTGILKFNLNGTLDTTFGTGGIITYGFSNLSNYNEWPNTFFQDANGKIIVAGISYPQSQLYSTKIALSRLNPNGTFDTTFGTNGKITFDHAPSIWSYNIKATAGNDYLVTFHEPSSSDKTTYTLKISNNGSIVTTFGTNGIASDIAGASNYNTVVLPDGKYLKAGVHNGQFSISRYQANGTSDSTFGTNGEINTAIGLSSSIHTIELQADGKLLAIGSSFDGNSRLITLARYTNVTLGVLDFSEHTNALLVYPNPIGNEATFEYTLNNDEKISIEILDLQGKTVRRIITDQYQKAGKQKLDFTLEGVSTGNYILKIASGKGKQSIHIVKK